MSKNEYIAVIRDSEKVIDEIPCTRIDDNNVGGTIIRGYPQEPNSGSIGYETTLAVIPASLMVKMISFPPYLPTPKETIEAFTQ